MLALLAGAALPIHAQTVTQGKVTFNGELIADTCAVMTESQDQVVPLPTVSVQSLDSAGDTAGSTPFQIKVDNCPATVNQVAAHFEMTNMEPAYQTLKNLATASAATNVSVQLIEADGTPIPLGSRGALYAVTGTGAARGAVMTYGGQYYALGATTPGVVTTYTQFTLAYP
ncbi:frimbrial protein [Achromobacter arsenitoxydans SY8]|uniref:Frimbrial protein n=1 Tax=Achromobacter arsenitoxydans SY8 TaxID=477184 RepID=H0F1Y0_9BURK|nr:frimbrial protein [Achromobacter arsenitoxydans SY8]